MQDGSVVDVEEANVALFLSNPIDFQKDKDGVTIDLTVYFQSKVALRGFQFEITDTEGNPFPMAQKPGNHSV